MSPRPFLLVLALLIAGLHIAVPTAHADRRSFLETYEYQTMPEGDVELEFWNRQTRATFDPDSPRQFKLEIEIEYGITAHWDIAVYQVFKQSTNPADPTQGSAFSYADTKLETRYRLGERGSNPIDTVLYFEIVREFPDDTWELEPKLILARDFGKFTAAFNAIAEIKLERSVAMPGGDAEFEVEFEPGWATGVTYEVSPKWKVGAESFGKVEFKDETEVQAFAGPSLSWAPSSKIWVAGTAALGLTSDTPDFQFGFIVGMGL